MEELQEARVTVIDGTSVVVAEETGMTTTEGETIEEMEEEERQQADSEEEGTGPKYKGTGRRTGSRQLTLLSDHYDAV
jgi:hypothetical protein